MGKSLKQSLAPQARALYAAGADYEGIAASLEVPAQALRRWAREAERAGEPWRRDGEPSVPPPRPTPKRRRRPRARVDRAGLCRRLEARLERLIERSEEDLEDAKVEDRMLKVCRVLESLRGDGSDLDAQMAAMELFADFCMQNLTEEEMQHVRGPIRQFVDCLKEEHS